MIKVSAPVFQRSVRRLAVLIVAGVALAATPASGRDAGGSFDYLYIEPDTGESSGGHSAIAFGDTVYHLQHVDPGLLRMVRETAESFDYTYRGLGNRSIVASRVSADDTSLAALRDEFERRYLAQTSHFELLESLARDRALLALLRDDPRSDAAFAAGWPATGIRLRGGGYFGCEGDARGAVASPALARLRDGILARRGAGFLDRRAARLRAAVEALQPEPRTVAPVERDLLATGGAGFADRYRELLLDWLAVDVLRNDLTPCSAAFRSGTNPQLALSAAEHDALTARSSALENALPRLLDSRRPDWGEPLLIGMARLVALERSLDSGRLIVVDTFATDADTVRIGDVESQRGALLALRDERLRDARKARTAAIRPELQGEAEWSRLEVATNLYLELERALRTENGTVREHPPRLLPSRQAEFHSGWPIPHPAPARVAGALAAARVQETRVKERLGELYPYDLVRHNCATEIFATIDAALVGGDGFPADARRRASRRALGGWVDGRHGLNFIPVVSAAAVQRRYRHVERERRTSYRLTQLRRLETSEGELQTYLRECNTLTSTLYHPGPRDGLFLLFTDDVFLPRPLYGALNLASEAAAAVAGLAWSPMDGGELLVSSLRGALFSLPELGFVNVRKGSMPILPRSWVEGATEGEPGTLCGWKDEDATCMGVSCMTEKGCQGTVAPWREPVG